MNSFDNWQFVDRENEIRDYMCQHGVTISDIAAVNGVCRSTVGRWLKRINSVSDWFRIVDRIAEYKAERKSTERSRYEEREADVRRYMRRRGVTIADLAADARCSRSTVARFLKSIKSVTYWFNTIDRIADLKQERLFR